MGGQRVRHILMIATVNDVQVARGRDRLRRGVVVKYSGSTRGDGALTRHAASLEALAENRPSFHALVPTLVCCANVEGHVLVVETAVDGAPLRLLSGAPRAKADNGSLVLLAKLHELERRVLTPDADTLDRWISAPIAILRQRPEGANLAEPCGRLEHELITILRKPMSVVRIHGDFTPPNILVSPDGEVTGLVDWESSSADDLPEVDLLQFALLSVPSEQHELGDLVAASLRDAQFPLPVRDLGVTALASAPNGLGIRAAVLLAWLHHVANNVRKSDGYGGRWYQDNVTNVLDAADATRAG